MDELNPKKRRGRPRLNLAQGGDIAELKKRACKINSEAKQRLNLPVKLRPDIYKEIADLAEKYHTSMMAIVENLIIDGLPRYGEFSNARGRDLMVTPTPLRAYAESLFTEIPRQPGNRSLVGNIDKYIEEVINPNDPAYQASLRVQRAAENIATPMPSSPRLRVVGEDGGLAE